MKFRAMKTFMGDGGLIRRGSLVEMTEMVSRPLLMRRLISEVVDAPAASDAETKPKKSSNPAAAGDKKTDADDKETGK